MVDIILFIMFFLVFIPVVGVMWIGFVEILKEFFNLY